MAKLNFEQFKNLRSQGLTVDQINSFEAGNVPQKPQEPQEPQESQQPGFFKQLEQFGQGAGEKFTNLVFPETFQKSIQGAAFESPKEYRQDVVTGKRPSDLQAAGGALQAALNVGSLALPGTRAINTAVGAGYGLGSALENKAGLGETALTTAGGALIGRYAPDVIGYAGKKAAGLIDSASEALVNATFHRTGRVLQQDIGKADFAEAAIKQGKELTDKLELPNFAKRYLREGKFFASNKSGRQWIVENVLDEASPVIRGFNKIAKSEVGDRAIPISDLKPELNDAIGKLSDVFGENSQLVKAVRKVSEGGRKEITWREGLELKRAINNRILPRAAFTDAKISVANQNLQNAIGELSDRLAEVAKDTNFKQLNNAYSLFKNAYNGLKAKATHKAIGLPELLLGAGGIAAAPFTAGTSLPSALGAIAAEKAARSVPVELGTAFGLQGIKKAGQAAAQSVPVRRTARAGLFNLLRGLNQQ